MKAIFMMVLAAGMAFGQMPYKNFRSNVPARRTEYYATTPARGGIKLTITAEFKSEFICNDQSYSCGDVWKRMYTGILEQKDGKIVAFEPTNPADKIIDSDLIGWVAFESLQAIDQDRQYLKTATEFTDEIGQHWMKK